MATSSNILATKVRLMCFTVKQNRPFIKIFLKILKGFFHSNAFDKIDVSNSVLKTCRLVMVDFLQKPVTLQLNLSIVDAFSIKARLELNIFILHEHLDRLLLV